MRRGRPRSTAVDVEVVRQADRTALRRRGRAPDRLESVVDVWKRWDGVATGRGGGEGGGRRSCCDLGESSSFRLDATSSQRTAGQRVQQQMGCTKCSQFHKLMVK